MVVVGSSLMVALNGLSAGFGNFIDESFSLLAPNILFVTSAQQDEASSSPFGGGGPPPVPKITLNAAVETRIRSLPFVSDVISSYQGQVQLESSGKTLSTSVFSIDPAKLYTIAPTLEFEEGSALRSRSEEHTSELQSRQYLVCRLLLEKKKHFLLLLTLSIFTLM